MKKSIFFIFIFIGVCAYSQSYRYITDAPPTKSEIIIKGRDMLLDAILEDNMQKADTVFSYMNNKVRDNDFAVFTPLEVLLLSCFLQHYDMGIKNVLYADSISLIPYNKRPVLIFPTNRYLESKLVEKFRGFQPICYTEIRNSDISIENKDFLILMLNKIFPQNDMITAENQITANDFLQKYPNSKYENYVKQNFLGKSPSKWLGSMNILGGMNTINGNLSNYFTNGFNLGMGFDFYYKKLYFGLQGNVFVSKLKQDYVFDENKIWLKGSNSSSFIGFVELGYNILQTKMMRITPFAGIGVVSFSPTQNTIDDQKELKKADLSSGLYLFGINSDFDIRPSTNIDKNLYWLRLRIEYGNTMGFAKTLKGNTLSISLGIIINFNTTNYYGI